MKTTIYNKRAIEIELPDSVLVKNQKKEFRKFITYDARKCEIIVTLRYDDQCGNGHNDFSITGEIRSIPKGRDCITCGCIHDDIKKYFPELKHLIKWHLTGSNGPMHYLGNAIYHASAKDCWGKLKGEPYAYKKELYFDSVPIAFKYDQKFTEWVLEQDKAGNYLGDIIRIDHLIGNKNYPNYTLSKYLLDWYECPFKTELDAEQFLQAYNDCEITFKENPTQWGEGKEPDLQAARHSAIWEDATLDDFTEEKLLQRLPALMDEFKGTIEALGFTY